MSEERVFHEFGPVYNEQSRILILGSFPSVKSRANQFYYGHPQNRFWKMLSSVLKDEIPSHTEGRKQFLLAHGIALWDVIESCLITGSSDSSIKEVLPNDITRITKAAPIEKILTNGTKAYELYQKYCYPVTGVEAIKMPSTSPANAAWSIERLCDAYEKVIAN